MAIIKIQNYYINMDRIVYYYFDQGNDNTVIICADGYVSVNGDYTKPITDEFKKIYGSKLIQIGD